LSLIALYSIFVGRKDKKDHTRC